MRTLLRAMAFSLLAVNALAEPSAVVLRMQDRNSNLFADRDAPFLFTVTSSVALQGRLGWRFSSSGRTLARGESALALEPDRARSVEVNVQLPQVKEGVVVEARLEAALFEPGVEGAVAKWEQTVWIFPADPFAQEKAWLKQLHLHLFDPAQNTARAFEALAIPFEPIHNLEAIPAIARGVVVIGEGVALDDYRGLDALMVETAARGVPVLCLALGEGTFVFPGSGDASRPQPQKIMFGRSERIAAFDKRLDAFPWAPGRKTATRNVMLRGERDQVLGEIVADSAQGWPWLEFSFGEGPRRLLLCGFGLLPGWEDAPTSRYLLAEMLRYLAAEQKNKSGHSQTTPKEGVER